jgi:hypothetical protein
MTRQKQSTPQIPQNALAEEAERAYTRFADQFTDMILDPNKEWLIEYLMARGFETVPTWEELNSDKFALSVLDKLRLGSWLVEQWLYEALRAKDREKLVPYFKNLAQSGGLAKDDLDRLLAVGKSAVLRESLKKLGASFSSHRGPQPKLPVWRYSELLKTAELLKPAIQKVLELAGTTSRTLPETLQYLQKDHSLACEFLFRHSNVLEQALVDPRLLRRAKKSIPARARVLADAMAGKDHKLTFSTSIERVRQARRLPSKTSS